MQTPDLSRQIAEYGGLVAHLAEGLSRSPRARDVRAEYDDLYQEGLISVWQALLRGVPVSAEVVEGRMLNYIRLQGRTSGADYGAILPLETVEEFVVT